MTRTCGAMSQDRTFPVLWHGTRKHRKLLDALHCPTAILWDHIESHRKQAMRNHDQTLERLAERGGLSPQELVAVLTDSRWNDRPAHSDRAAVAFLRELGMI